MRMHTAAVVAEERLGHEGDGFAVPPSHVLGDVFEPHQVIGGSDQRVVTKINFCLTSSGYLVMLPFDLDAYVGHHPAHLCSYVLEAVGRLDREIALLVSRLVSPVSTVLVAPTVPLTFLRVDDVEA